MKTLHFTIVIHAARQKVWRTMLEQESYKVWTAAFTEGSYYEGSWDKGKKIKFLAPDGEGMTSMIVENKPFEFISIKHLGILKDGLEVKESPESKSWAGALESYTFSKLDGATEVKVDVDATPEFEDFMSGAWPKALARLKEICEV